MNGQPRPDLSECDEIDLSATPFCKSMTAASSSPTRDWPRRSPRRQLRKITRIRLWDGRSGLQLSAASVTPLYMDKIAARREAGHGLEIMDEVRLVEVTGSIGDIGQ